jgi:7-dehydrocholesterol reductase
MDIAHDRAGYYLCWGCLNWVPGVYTSQALYLTNHPNKNMTTTLALGTILVGAVMIYINWEADIQRQMFRESNGKCRIWGKEPLFIIAKYKTGTLPRNLFLSSLISNALLAQIIPVMHLRTELCRCSILAF